MTTPVKPLRFTSESREIAFETARIGVKEKFVSKDEYYREIRRLNAEENKYRRRIGARNFNEVRAYQEDIIQEENRRRAERIAQQARQQQRQNLQSIRQVKPTETIEQMGIQRISYNIPRKVAINTDEAEKVFANTIANAVRKIRNKKEQPKERRYIIRIDTPNGWKSLGVARELLGTMSDNQRAIERDIREWRKQLREEYDAELDIDQFEIIELLSKAEVDVNRKQRQQQYFNQQKQLEKYAFIDEEEKPKRKQLATKAARKVPIKGGCDSNTHHKKVGDLKVMSPKSRNNNCLLACIHHFLDIKTENKFIYEHKRKELGLTEGLISIDKLTDIARHYKITINLFNIGAELVNTYNAGCDKVCNMMLFIQENGLGHYVLIEGEVKLCDKCGKNWIKKHKCNLRRQMWINRMSGKRNVIPANVNRDTKHDDSQMFYFDLETFKDEGTFAITPYAVGWDCDNVYQQRYGKDAWAEFYNFAIKQRNKILCAYNGSSFDFHFLLNHLLMEGEQIKDMILSNGRIMSFTFGDNIRCWDLCLFT